MTLGACGVLVLAGLAALPLDAVLFNWLRVGSVPSELNRFLHQMEGFGTVYGVAVILLTAGVLSPELRPRLGRVAACAVSAGLLANVGKLLVARERPKSLRADLDHAATLSETMPDWNTSMLFDSAVQSFPSAHTAVAVAFAFALSQLLPRGRTVFFTLAGCVGLQRIVSLHHFPSDVLVGAAVGLLVGVAWSWAPRHAEAASAVASRPDSQKLAA